MSAAASRVLAFLVSLLLLIMLFLAFGDLTVLDESYANVPANIASVRLVELERICNRLDVQAPNLMRNCCIVADVLNFERNTASRVIYFAKLPWNATHIHHEYDSVDFESELPLIPPPGMSVRNSDTRLWLIDHRKLLNEYVATMALLPFVLVHGLLNTTSNITAGAEPIQKQQLRNFLVIGLGGGSLDMFWHTRFPSVYITVYELDPNIVSLANRWFRTVDDQTRRIVVGDGLKAIENATRQCEHFDIIVVDACDSTHSMPCPSSPFLQANVLENIRAALKPMGVFVLNVLPLVDEQIHVQMVESKLLTAFGTCIRARMAKQMNNIFACVPYRIAPDDREQMLNLWNMRIVKHAHQMGFQNLLAGINLTTTR